MIALCRDVWFLSIVCNMLWSNLANKTAQNILPTRVSRGKYLERLSAWRKNADKQTCRCRHPFSLVCLEVPNQYISIHYHADTETVPEWLAGPLPNAVVKPPLKCLTARQERGVRIDRNLLSEKLKASATYITEQLYYQYHQLIFNTHFYTPGYFKRIQKARNTF